jgi:hypothetical protein
MYSLVQIVTVAIDGWCTTTACHPINLQLVLRLAREISGSEQAGNVQTDGRRDSATPRLGCTSRTAQLYSCISCDCSKATESPHFAEQHQRRVLDTAQAAQSLSWRVPHALSRPAMPAGITVESRVWSLDEPSRLASANFRKQAIGGVPPWDLVI